MQAVCFLLSLSVALPEVLLELYKAGMCRSVGTRGGPRLAGLTSGVLAGCGKPLASFLRLES